MKINPIEIVLAAERQLAAAMVNADVAAIDKLLSDDLSYTHSNAKLETKADVLETAKSGSTKYESISYDTTTARQYGDTVVTTHNMTFVVQPHTNKIYVTFVWTKQPAGWQLVARQATRLP